jgi:hypothetical protein
MLRRIKSFFASQKGLPRAQVEELERLPAAERLARLGFALHDRCVKEAARFVEEEHRRPDSPFNGLPRTDLFHEMLVMNFWILERILKGKRPTLLERAYRHYSASFIWGRESPQQELMAALRGKFRIYDRSWDDHTGHQDVFARQAIGIIFGDQECAEPAQAAFWLITHADRTMKDFAEVRKSVDQLLGKVEACRADE